MEEKWVELKEYPQYFVSSYGRVWSEKTHKMLVPCIRSKTSMYLYVNFCIGKSKMKKENIHRLVAKYFLDPPDSPDMEVNHIDGVKTNNFATNLEWVTKSENAKHAYRLGLRHTQPKNIQKAINSRKRKVINLDTGETFESVCDCARAINGRPGGIDKCVRGIRKRYKGMRFSYA